MEVEPTVYKYDPLPTNEWMEAVIEKEEVVDSPFDPEKKQKSLKVLFRIDDEKYEEFRGKKIPRNYGLHWPPENPTAKQLSKLFGLASAVFPGIAPGGKFQTTTLKDQRVRIMIEDYIRQDTKPGQRVFKESPLAPVKATRKVKAVAAVTEEGPSL